jgi:hypothetical protein
VFPPIGNALYHWMDNRQFVSHLADPLPEMTLPVADMPQRTRPITTDSNNTAFGYDVLQEFACIPADGPAGLPCFDLDFKP